MQEDFRSKEGSLTSRFLDLRYQVGLASDDQHRKRESDLRSCQQRQMKLEDNLRRKDSQLAEDEGKAKTKRGQYQTDLNQLNLDKESLQEKKKLMFSRRAQHLRDKVQEYLRWNNFYENELVQLIAPGVTRGDGQSCPRVQGHQSG